MNQTILEPLVDAETGKSPCKKAGTVMTRDRQHLRTVDNGLNKMPTLLLLFDKNDWCKIQSCLDRSRHVVTIGNASHPGKVRITPADILARNELFLELAEGLGRVDDRPPRTVGSCRC